MNSPDNIVALHRGVAPLRTDPREHNGDTDAAWVDRAAWDRFVAERMDASDRYAAEFLQLPEYQPHRLTFGERLVIHFDINGDFYTGILLGGVVVSLIICAAATLIAHVRLG
jgi:hypothetical protein